MTDWRPLTDGFTIENGMLTPTLQPKREVIAARFESELSALYD